MVKDDSNLKQTWTRGMVSLHFWRVSFWTVQGQLRYICPMGWQNLYFCQIATFSLLTQKLFNRFAHNFQVNCAISTLFMYLKSRNLLLTFLLSFHVSLTSKFQVNFRFDRYWWFCLINFWNFHTIHVFEVRESNADISTELACLSYLENLGQLPVRGYLEGTDDCILWIFTISSLLFMFSRSRNPLLTFWLSYDVWLTSKI